MRRMLIVASLAIALSYSSNTLMAQDEIKRYELGAQFTSITKPDFFGSKTEPGLGGRFTFNVNEKVALEAEGDFFPSNCQTCNSENTGTLQEALFGVKLGKRFRRFGIFAKARPGFASFSQGNLETSVITIPNFQFPLLIFERSRQTNFAFDLGGVIELYHGRRIFTRFDAGDTMIHYRRRIFENFFIDPVTGGVAIIPIIRPAETRHNFQFSAGVGFRF
jgi:hypothetical protein